MIIAEEKIRFVESTVCEINSLKKGDIEEADGMLMAREEAYIRVWAMECLIAEQDSSFQSIINYLYEQIKELALKLTIKE